MKHAGEFKFMCKFCGRTFTRESFYKIHLRVHTACEECGKCFWTAATLKKHKLRYLFNGCSTKKRHLSSNNSTKSPSDVVVNTHDAPTSDSHYKSLMIRTNDSIMVGIPSRTELLYSYRYSNYPNPNRFYSEFAISCLQKTLISDWFLGENVKVSTSTF